MLFHKARPTINEGDQLFLEGGTRPFGAVRDIRRGPRPFLTVWIENHGEAEIPGSCVVDVHDGKVILSTSRLPDHLREWIHHAHDEEA